LILLQFVYNVIASQTFPEVSWWDNLIGADDDCVCQKLCRNDFLAHDNTVGSTASGK